MTVIADSSGCMARGVTKQDFVFKTTNQFSLDERKVFCKLFSQVFQKNMSDQQFDRKYLYTPLGYSHHGLMFVDGNMVGAYNLIPYRYRCFGAERLFGLSVDMMIDKEHRAGPFNVVEIAKLACEGAKQDGIDFLLGFPNENSYQFTKRLLKWRDIGELDFYILPINIGAIKPKLRFLNTMSRAFARIFVHLPRVHRCVTPDFNIEKVYDGCFEEHRYDNRHRILDCDGKKCVYRLCTEEDGIRVLYIIDVHPLTSETFRKVIRRVYPIAAAHADLILYVGRLPFIPPGLIKVPRFKQPHRIMMCGKLLNNQWMNEYVFAIENWNVNISNFDVR
jgi:hypothetical protein